LGWGVWGGAVVARVAPRLLGFAVRGGISEARRRPVVACVALP